MKYWIWRVVVPEVIAPGVDKVFQHKDFELTKEQLAIIGNLDSDIPEGYMPGNWGLVKDVTNG